MKNDKTKNPRTITFDAVLAVFATLEKELQEKTTGLIEVIKILEGQCHLYEEGGNKDSLLCDNEILNEAWRAVRDRFGELFKKLPTNFSDLVTAYINETRKFYLDVIKEEEYRDIKEQIDYNRRTTLK